MGRGLHIEPTSRCTIECPLCPRTTEKGSYRLGDIDIDTAVKACHGFDWVTLCGNHGDPIYHPRFHDLISSMRSAYPSMDIDIVTNGAYRSADWWETTASILNNDDDSITFSIDGIPSNNHIYRVNSRWDHIETAIRTVRARRPHMVLTWKFILFKYNESDAGEAVELARGLGINRFKIVQSSRTEDHNLNPSRTITDVRGDLDA